MEGIFTDDDLFPKQSIEDVEPGCVNPDFVQEDCLPPRKWVPRVRTGFFYNRDRQYYLYDKKASAYLMELTWTRLRLTDIIDPETAIVEFRGFQVPESSYRFDGHYIEVNHAGLSHPGTHIEGVHLDVSKLDPFDLGIVFNPSEFVTVRGTSKFSVAGSGAFTTISVEQRLPLIQGTLFYEFPVIPNPRAPIVITDDTMEPWDRRQISPEFRVDYTTGRFHINEYRNLMRNGDFSEGLDYWHVLTGTVTVETENATFGELKSKAAVGNNYIMMDSDGSMSQLFPAQDNQTYSVQFRARAEVDTTITVRGISRDITGAGAIGDVVFNIEGGEDWTEFSTSYTLIGGSVSFELIFFAGDDDCEVDTIQTVVERYPVDFFQAHPLSTVEYEIGDGIWYEHHRLIRYDRFGKVQYNHFPLGEIDLNPVTSVLHDGFLYFHESDELSDWQLGMGGVEFDSAADPVTSFVKGRRHVPYAKVSGPGKFIQTGVFNLFNPNWTEEIVDVSPTPQPASVSIKTFSGTTIIEHTGLSLAWALKPGDKQVELSLGHGITVSEGHLKIVDPATSEEKIVFFVERNANTFILGQPFGFSAPIGTAVEAETRRLRIKEEREIDFVVTVEDGLSNAMDQYAGATGLTVLSGSSGDLEVSTLVNKTNQDGQHSYKVTGVNAGTIMLFEYTAGSITADLEIEVV